MTPEQAIASLRAAGLITDGTEGPIWEAMRVAALLELHTDTLAQAMSTAYKSVGSWGDFDDTVLAFAEATVREYAALEGAKPA
jgi:hypothetical protein